MISTPQLKELLNELKLSKNKNNLLFIILNKHAKVDELMDFLNSNGFNVHYINLKKVSNPLKVMSEWKKTSDNTIYIIFNIFTQFPWILGYLNIHRDIFYEIKRPILIVVSDKEIREIQKHAPDLYRFRSRTYSFNDNGKSSEGLHFYRSEPIYYPMQVFEEKLDVNEIRNRIKYDSYLLDNVNDDYKISEIYMSLALDFFKLDDLRNGEEYLEKSINLKKELRDQKGIIMNYSRILPVFISKKLFNKALDLSNEILKETAFIKGFNLHNIYLARGLAYNSLGYYEKAIEDYTKAIEFVPISASTYFNRGNAYMDLNQLDNAKKDFTKVIKLDPNLSGSYYNLGNICMIRGQYETAIQEYCKTIELEPMMAEAYVNRGSAYRELGQYSKAIEDYAKAKELNSQLPEAYSNNGDLYRAIGDYNKAIENYDRALQLNPNIIEAYINLGSIYKDLNKYESSIENFTKVIELDPKNIMAYVNRGNAYMELGRYKEAIEDQNKALGLDPKRVSAYVNRCGAFIQMGQYDKALEDCSSALEIDENSAEGYLVRSMLYRVMNQNEKAIEDYAKAIQLDPSLAASDNVKHIADIVESDEFIGDLKSNGKR